MNKKKKEKRFWKSYFGVTCASLVPEKIKRLAWKEQSVTDEDLEFLCSRVKYIFQMDLDHNLVTNNGIEYLTLLSGIEELRLKGLNIDDSSIKFIEKINGLRLLHLAGTNISSDGIGRLSSLTSLEKLLCTPDPIDPIPLRKFKESLPNCELIVNYKVFEETKTDF